MSPRRLLRVSLLIGSGLFLTTAALRAETYHNWCLAHFSAAEIAAGLASPTRDGDNDLCVNIIEYLGGTDPMDFHTRVEIDLAPAPALETIVFPMALDREDAVYEIVVSRDLESWVEDAVHVCAGPTVSWRLNGYPFVKLGVKRRIGYRIDSDQDGLDDFFEESLVAADPGDAITHIGEVLPGDDFDSDGTTNLDEPANAAQPMPGGSFAAPGVVDPAALNCALASLPLAPAGTLVVFTPLH